MELAVLSEHLYVEIRGIRARVEVVELCIGDGTSLSWETVLVGGGPESIERHLVPDIRKCQKML